MDSPISNDDWVSRVRRQLRIVSILSAAEIAGIAPLPTVPLHTIAYFTDALAPVWGLRIFDAQLLKRREGPMSPILQHDVDLLVTRGVVTAQDTHHVRDGDRAWRLDARYALNGPYAEPILAAVDRFEAQAQQHAFVSEVVNAVSGLGLDGIAKASSTDAAYGDVLVDFGGLLDIGGSARESNLSAQVAFRFGQLSQPRANLSSSEMVHLYVRQLYARLTSAA